MPMVTLVAALLPGQGEAFRRFAQALQGSRGAELSRAEARLGVTLEAAWALSAVSGDAAVVRIRM